jgi:hypothetical protein
MRNVTRYFIKVININSITKLELVTRYFSKEYLQRCLRMLSLTAVIRGVNYPKMCMER